MIMRDIRQFPLPRAHVYFQRLCLWKKTWAGGMVTVLIQYPNARLFVLLYEHLYEHVNLCDPSVSVLCHGSSPFCRYLDRILSIMASMLMNVLIHRHICVDKIATCISVVLSNVSCNV